MSQPTPLLTTLLLTLLLLTPGCEQQNQTAIDITIDGQTFNLQLALDAQARYQGLSDRKSIPENGGMLFVMPVAREQYFVMRKCLVPIDIIFLDPEGRIVAMHQMQTQPYDTPEKDLKRYHSHWPAQFAIELQGGALNKLNLKLSQQIQLPTESLIQRAR